MKRAPKLKKKILRVDASSNATFLGSFWLAVSRFEKYDDNDPENVKIAYTRYRYHVQWKNIKQDLLNFKAKNLVRAPQFTYAMASIVAMVVLNSKEHLFNMAFAGTLAYDAASGSTGNDNNVTPATTKTLTWSHTTSGANRLLINPCGLRWDNIGTTISGTTYNGVSTTLIDSQQGGVFTGCINYMWGLIAPASGANNIVVTYNVASGGLGDLYKLGIGVSFTGASQTTGWHNTGKATGTDLHAIKAITSATGEIVIDSLYAHKHTTAGSDPVSDQTQRQLVSQSSGGGTEQMASSTAAGGASVSMGYTSIDTFFALEWNLIATSVMVGPSSFTSTLTDGVTNTDSLLKSTVRTLADGVTNTGSMIRSIGRSLLEAVTNTDVFTGAKIYLRTLTETVTNTDVFARVIVFGRVLTETITNTATALKGAGRNLVDTVTNTDIFTKASNYARTFTDAVTTKAWLYANGALLTTIWRYMTKNVSNVWRLRNKNQ